MSAPTTLNQLFLDAAERYGGGRTVMRRKIDGQWQGLGYPQLRTRVHRVLTGLLDLGVRAGDRVAILSENRPEWAIVDYACLAARLVDVPIYPTLPPSQASWILRDAGASVVFVSSAAFLEKIQQVRGELPALRHVFVFDDVPLPADAASLTSLEALGAAAEARFADWEVTARAVRPGDLATLIYTSGTTGDPKGVMLSHGNITSNVVAALDLFALGSSDRYLSFLPLCHIFERMVGHYTMLHAGAAIDYATSFETVAAEMADVHPTVVASVPRLYEKIHSRVTEAAIQSGGMRRAIFEWARATAEKKSDYVFARQRVPPGLRLGARLADRLVFSKLRRRTGDRIRFFVSGGAPLAPDICRFFFGAGLPILEGYGLTETSPVIAVNTFDMIKCGTVGRPIPGVEVRIAPDGEILARGPNIMLGYYRQPEATAAAIDPEGWFHTGDVGEIDNDGCLRITDRKKDLIKTSGGKYIAPQPIENMLRTNEYFTNAVLLGDRHKFPFMLLVPNFAVLEPWLVSQGITERDPERLVQLPPVQERLEREARRSLRDLAQFETPKRFLLLPHDFTVESGELTVTMKARRRVIEQHYQRQIEQLFAGLD